MDIESVRAWLNRKLRFGRAWKLVAAAASLLSGLLILYISFWVSYALIWFVSRSFFPLKHNVLLLIAGGFMALVVVVGARQNRESLQPLDRQLALAKDLDIRLTPYTRYGMSYNTNAVKAGVFEVRSIASVVNYILCGGVVLVLGSVGKLREFRRLKGIDVDGCARVLTLLQAIGKRQSFEEIVERLPGLNPVRVFEDLRYVDGVLFLANEPPGLMLHPELKSELNGLVKPASIGPAGDCQNQR